MRDHAPHPVLDPQAEGQEPAARKLWDHHEPRSLPRILPPDFVEICQRVMNQDAQLFGLDEKTLKKILMDEKRRRPSAVGNRLRMKFWNEYDRAQGTGTAMRLSNIWNGICFEDQFYTFIRDVVNLSWLLCPPTNYVVLLEEGLNFGLEKLRDILELEVIDQKGRVNAGLAKVQLEIVGMLADRLKGAVAQRHEHRSLNVNMNATPPGSEIPAGRTSKKIADMVASMSIEEMKARLAEAKKRNNVEPVLVIEGEGAGPLAMGNSDE